uniref:Uncharacterized protein n=1 Tax=Hanusia phi TaxID=3032 RepID=A0A7S0HQJ0_9CRYP|mmetsp:Transcript_28343/g.64221  ORF Transcript_28343/g.64221 Transcript_28343/m.64221 type:complete len:474 (+) Transcript_28343:135-1556(+)
MLSQAVRQHAVFLTLAFLLCSPSTTASKPSPNKANNFMQDSRTYMQQLDSCKAPNNALCPSSDIVLDDQKGKCVKSMVLCFNQTVKSVNLTALNAPCGTMGNEHFCVAQDSCNQGLPCAPAAMECSANMSYRCADWSCAASEQDCPTYSAGANQVLCPDGVTKKSDWAGCAQAAITWQGCPPWQSSCSSNPKYCGSKDMSCEQLTGCSDSLQSCGLKRDNNGTAIINATTKRPEFICAQSCDRPPSPGPVPQTAMLMPGTANQQIMLNSSDGMTAFALKASSQNAFRRVDNATDAVNFTISSVVSSILQQGPFAQYFKAGKIVSEVITIEPSADLTIEGGLQIDIPLAGTAESCTAMLGQLELVVVSDLLNFSAMPERVGNCSKGAIGNCSCLCSIYHFSTYAVADIGVPATTTTTETPAPTSTPSSPPSPPSPAVPAPVVPPTFNSGASSLSGSGTKMLISFFLLFVATIRQ